MLLQFLFFGFHNYVVLLQRLLHFSVLLLSNFRFPSLFIVLVVLSCQFKLAFGSIAFYKDLFFALGNLNHFLFTVFHRMFLTLTFFLINSNVFSIFYAIADLILLNIFKDYSIFKYELI